jgi:galactose mutarotase-like enzyme
MFAVRSSRRGDLDTVVLADEAQDASVTIVPERGAIAISFVAHGREWLYLDEATLQDLTANVRGGIPVLFPSPGKLEDDTFAWSGKSGAMKQHGFARNSRFHEIGRGTDGSAWVELELVDSAATRAVFPFHFRLRLCFRLCGARLTVRAEVHNTGEGLLPFALGYHPYFAVPVAEKRACHIPTCATRAWDNKHERDITLGAIDLASDEVDLHLHDHGSNGATLETPSGAIDLGGHFTRWVIWTLPSKDFVCLEPWTAPADALNTGEGLIEVAPGTERSLELTIAVRRAP